MEYRGLNQSNHTMADVSRVEPWLAFLGEDAIEEGSCWGARIQQLLHERVRFAPICDDIWPSGVGPRVDEPALMLIDPYPWSAPLEEVRLKKK